jgi:1-acyl-sn-glycerol-3-phosphate acyltransferase
MGDRTDKPLQNGTSIDAQRVLEVVRQVVSELMGEGLGVGLDSDFERHLGLGSLERVELAARLEAEFQAALPDRALLEARTPRQMIEALAARRGQPRAGLAGPAGPEAAAPVPYRVPTETEVQTLLEVLRYRVEHEGNRPHLRVLDDALQPQTVGYADLWHQALGTAAGLSARGLRRGDRVALLLPTGRDFFVAFMGVLACAAVPVPIYPPVRLDDLAPYLRRQVPILANAGVGAILTDSLLRSVAGLLRDRLPQAEHVLTVASAAEDTGFAIAQAGEEDLGLIQYTSGSTGDPKGVALPHRSLLANMRANGKGAELGPEDVCVSWLPLYHDMGLIGAWLTSMLYGMPLVLMSPVQFLSRPERWLWAIHRFRGSISAAPNFGYELCCRKIPDSALEHLDLSSWRVALNGSEPVLAETIDRFCARFGPHGFRRGAMMPVYGMAETCVGLAFPPPGREPRIDVVGRDRFLAEGRAVPCPDDGRPVLRVASVGRPLAGHAIRLAAPEDPLGAEVPERTEGRILFQGPSTMAGYFQRPDATEAVRAGAWIDTGDLGYTADGELYVTGRVKDLVIKGGRKYHPQDIERAAAAVEGVRKGCVAAFAAPDPQRGEAIVVVAETQRPEAEHSKLSRRVSEAVLEAIGTPADQIVWLRPGAIPKTSSGKLRRRETRRMFLEGRLERRRRPALQLLGVAFGSAGARLGAAARGARRLGYGLAATGLGRMLLALGSLRVMACRDREAAWSAAQSWLRFLFAAIGVPNRRTGEPWAQGPAVLVANHGSYLDPLFLLPHVDRPLAILAIEEAFGWPLIGPCLRRLEAVPVERTGGRASLDSYERTRQALRRGRQVLIFPEGTFGPAEGVRPFRLGAFRLAAEEGVPIQPIGIRGVRHVYREGRRLLCRGPVEIVALAPVAPAPRDSLRQMAAQRDAVRQAVAQACGEPLLQIASVAPLGSGAAG